MQDRAVGEQGGAGSTFVRGVTVLGAVVFGLTGLGAFFAPEAFFDGPANFAPYNQHFLQDIGAFNLGIAAVLVLALRPRADALAVALLGAAVGSAFHVVSHVIGADLGGSPAQDITVFTVLTTLLAVAGIQRWRETA